MIKQLRYVVALMAISCLSCGKNNDPIPDVAVDFAGSLDSPQLLKLKGANVAVNINGGVAGIVIYHRPDNVYVAYDRCSTVDPAKKCAVNIDNGDFTVTDPCSGAQFSLFDGTPVKKPGTIALKAYNIIVDPNSDTISITN